MAWFRLLWWWHTRRRMTAEHARVLRNLLLIQSIAFVMMLVLGSVIVFGGSTGNSVSIYVLGFGTGWILAIRYYVWRYVG